MSGSTQPLKPGQRLSLTGPTAGAPSSSSFDNSASSGQQLVRVSKSNQQGYDVIALDVAKVTGNPELVKYLPGAQKLS